MRAIQRHPGTLSILLALAVLQTPFCALACLEAEVPARSMEASAPPCHGEPAPPEPKHGEPSPHVDCGCESIEATVGSRESSLDPPRHARVASAPLYPVATRRPREIAPVYEADLPPRDLLLRKSTLII